MALSHVGECFLNLNVLCLRFGMKIADFPLLSTDISRKFLINCVKLRLKVFIFDSSVQAPHAPPIFLVMNLLYTIFSVSSTQVYSNPLKNSSSPSRSAGGT